MTEGEFQDQARRVEQGRRLLQEIETLRNKIRSVREASCFALADNGNRSNNEVGYGRIDFGKVCNLDLPNILVKDLVETIRNSIIEIYAGQLRIKQAELEAL